MNRGRFEFLAAYQYQYDFQVISYELISNDLYENNNIFQTWEDQINIKIISWFSYQIMLMKITI